MKKNQFHEKNNKTGEYFIKILSNLEMSSEINECEYVYIDEIDIKHVKCPLLENKIVITKKINDYFMLESDKITNNPQMTKLNYKHIVDLLILINQENKNLQDIKELMDKDTIIIKNLGNDIIYIEDKRQEIKTIITEYEQIVLTQNGINTKLKYYEKHNQMQNN